MTIRLLSQNANLHSYSNGVQIEHRGEEGLVLAGTNHDPHAQLEAVVACLKQLLSRYNFREPLFAERYYLQIRELREQVSRLSRQLPQLELSLRREVQFCESSYNRLQNNPENYFIPTQPYEQFRDVLAGLGERRVLDDQEVDQELQNASLRTNLRRMSLSGLEELERILLNSHPSSIQLLRAIHLYRKVYSIEYVLTGRSGGNLFLTRFSRIEEILRRHASSDFNFPTQLLYPTEMLVENFQINPDVIRRSQYLFIQNLHLLARYAASKGARQEAQNILNVALNYLREQVSMAASSSDQQEPSLQEWASLRQSIAQTNAQILRNEPFEISMQESASIRNQFSMWMRNEIPFDHSERSSSITELFKNNSFLAGLVVEQMLSVGEFGIVKDWQNIGREILASNLPIRFSSRENLLTLLDLDLQTLRPRNLLENKLHTLAHNYWLLNAVLSNVDSATEERLWQGILECPEIQAIRVPRENFDSYAHFRAFLQHNHFDTPTVGVRQLSYLLRFAYNRQNLEQMGRNKPLVLVTSSRLADHNLALTDVGNRDRLSVPITLIEDARFDVIYIPCSNEDDVFNALEEVGRRSGRPLSKWFRDTHGNEQGQSYGQGSSDEDTLDISDFNERYRSLLHYFSPNIEIINVSCRNGFLGRNNPDNFANQEAAFLRRNHVPFRSISYFQETGWWGIRFSGDTRETELLVGEGGTYVIDERR